MESVLAMKLWSFVVDNLCMVSLYCCVAFNFPPSDKALFVAQSLILLVCDNSALSEEKHLRIRYRGRACIVAEIADITV
jgi:hypothetical protein